MQVQLDARILKTRRNLKQAALSLAAQSPISLISVVELADAAGINRTTFYKHADTPLQVLESALVEDLDGLRSVFLLDASSDDVDFVELWQQAATGTISHVEKYSSVYQQGFSKHSDGTLEMLLSRHISESMHMLFEEHHELLPAHQLPDRKYFIEAYSAFLGSGLTSILKVWLNTENREISNYNQAVLSTLPKWMLEPKNRKAK